ncbi:Transcription initiation factor IIE subunit beta [Puttea exsequens]|nr:Transcription initiation factor IIE subunit beta [Puttea exsequens]
MSYLQNQINAFKASVNQSSTKISSKRPGINANASSSANSPATGGSPLRRPNDQKRKRPDQANITYSQPANTGTGENVMTQISYAVTYLKEKGTAQTFTDLINYLSIHHRDSQYKRLVQTILMNHEKVIFDPKNDGGEGTFSFRPAHDIRSSDSLLGFLQSQRTFQGLSVRELKDGWPDVEAAIDDLDRVHKILAYRNKKDLHPKTVWLNDPSLYIDVDQEFKDIWGTIKLPEPGAVADELEKEGLTPANKSRAIKKAPAKQKEKPRKRRAGGKTTNVHMQGVLRDYSHLKK